MSPLAKAVLDIEELSPGEADAEVIVPAEDWATLVKLARAEVTFESPACVDQAPKKPKKGKGA